MTLDLYTEVWPEYAQTQKLAWRPPERPYEAVYAAYALALPFKPFRRALEIGTHFRRAEVLSDDLDTTEEPILGTVVVVNRKYDLVIALHVLEHVHDLHAAAADLWRLGDHVLVEVPALEVETVQQEYDDVNPGHIHHLSMGDLIRVVGGTVLACEAVRKGSWPCNRLLASKGRPSLEKKTTDAHLVYAAAADLLRAHCKDGDAYLGDGYSLAQLRSMGAPELPIYDTFKNPVPKGFSGRLILTPRYSPTRAEMKCQFRHTTLFDPWAQLAFEAS